MRAGGKSFPSNFHMQCTVSVLIIADSCPGQDLNPQTSWLAVQQANHQTEEILIKSSEMGYSKKKWNLKKTVIP